MLWVVTGVPDSIKSGYKTSRESTCGYDGPLALARGSIIVSGIVSRPGLILLNDSPSLDFDNVFYKYAIYIYISLCFTKPEYVNSLMFVHVEH